MNKSNQDENQKLVFVVDCRKKKTKEEIAKERDQKRDQDILKIIDKLRGFMFENKIDTHDFLDLYIDIQELVTDREIYDSLDDWFYEFCE